MTTGKGRRAVAQEATLHHSSQSAEEENNEKDAALRQVQARDLIDFGMIPVRFFKYPHIQLQKKNKIQYSL